MTAASDPTPAVHERIARRLAELVTGDPAHPPHPYIRRYLAEHADHGNALDDQHLPPEFLPWETSGRVRSLLGLPLTDPGDRPTLTAWACIEPFLAGVDPPGKRASLAIAHAAVIERPLRARAEPVTDFRIDVRWARWEIPNNVVGTAGAEILALVGFPGPDGRTLLATGSTDGTVRLWDPARGTAVSQPLTGHTDTVQAVAAVDLADGRTLLATGSADGTVRLWDPARGTVVGQPLTGHSGGVWAVAAVGLADGRTLLATGSTDGTVRLWDPARGTAVGELQTGHTDWVLTMAAVGLADGRTLLATGGGDATVRLWDPARGTAVGRPLTGHTGGVLTVAAVDLADGRTLLATGSADGTVRLWDPARGTAVGELQTGHTDGVGAVAAVDLADGRTLLATGSTDGTVRLWDPATRAELMRAVLVGPIYALAAENRRGEGPASLVVGGPGGLTLLTVGTERSSVNWGR